MHPQFAIYIVRVRFIKIMKLTFGKHEGKELKEVAAEYPSYIFWMTENNVMEIPEHIIELASESQRLDLPEPDFEMIHGDDWGDRD
jgi:hypothetical protein